MQEDAPADIEAVEGIEEIAEEDDQSRGPPKASVPRRSQSYSNFHDAKARLARGKDVITTPHNESGTEVKTDLDFLSWYGEFNNELLDASHEEYM